MRDRLKVLAINYNRAVSPVSAGGGGLANPGGRELNLFPAAPYQTVQANQMRAAQPLIWYPMIPCA